MGYLLVKKYQEIYYFTSFKMTVKYMIRIDLLGSGEEVKQKVRQENNFILVWMLSD